MTTSYPWSNENQYPWEKWRQLPKEEREAETREALKNKNQVEDLRQYIINQGGDPDGPNLLPEYPNILSGTSDKGEVDALTGKTTNTENVGDMSSRATSTGDALT